ncbi:hypothetical protein B0H14DRAFT_2617696 [Mycena olivaceomarginata]|nr:hypothetical protein B0H14DRAFT_2617696 [Mycena olivaceomarginata]
MSGGGAKGSAGPSVAGTPAGSEADVAGGEDEDGVELRVPLKQWLSGRTGTRPGDINIQPAQSRVTVGVRLERGSASMVLRSNGSGERLGEHRDMMCSSSWCDTLVDADPEVEVEGGEGGRGHRCADTSVSGSGWKLEREWGWKEGDADTVAKTTRWMRARRRARPQSTPTIPTPHPCYPRSPGRSVTSGTCHAATAFFFMLVRVVCNSKPAQQPSPERLFTLAYTTALSGMHGDKDECKRLQATGILGASRPASGLPTTRAAGLRH